MNVKMEDQMLIISKYPLTGLNIKMIFISHWVKWSHPTFAMSSEQVQTDIEMNAEYKAEYKALEDKYNVLKEQNELLKKKVVSLESHVKSLNRWTHSSNCLCDECNDDCY